MLIFFTSYFCWFSLTDFYYVVSILSLISTNKTNFARSFMVDDAKCMPETQVHGQHIIKLFPSLILCYKVQEEGHN